MVKNVCIPLAPARISGGTRPSAKPEAYSPMPILISFGSSAPVKFFPFIITPFPVKLGYFFPRRSSKAAETTENIFPIDITANAGAYQESAEFPVISSHILLMGIQPAPFPPPMIGRATLIKLSRGFSPTIRAAATVNKNDTTTAPKIAGIKPAKALISSFRSMDKIAPVINTKMYKSRNPTVSLKLLSVSTTESGTI